MKKITFGELRNMASAAKGRVDKIYLHWTAGTYDKPFDDYHINIDGNGNVITSTDDLTEHKSHTWQRNGGAVGIALCCCYDAIVYPDGRVFYGEYPPTPKQVEAMAKVVQVLCEGLGLDINEYTVQTHAEVASEDGYGVFDDDPDMRWDLLLLQDFDGTLKSGGSIIRGKALWYSQLH